MDKLVVALDAGSTRVRALVVGQDNGQDPEILGHGFVESNGITRSTVVDMEAATRCHSQRGRTRRR